MEATYCQAFERTGSGVFTLSRIPGTRAGLEILAGGPGAYTRKVCLGKGNLMQGSTGIFAML